jgi:hypothetical protein
MPFALDVLATIYSSRSAARCVTPGICSDER